MTRNSGKEAVQRDSPRKLAAILAADIVGYSRLMGSDETGTHLRVQKIMRHLIRPAIAAHRGCLVKTTGDGFLAVFESPVEAVRCAIFTQRNISGHNHGLPLSQWVQFRIGVNLGDVIVEGEDIYGESVNIAARLERLAEPGSVYISGGLHEEVKREIGCAYQPLGYRRLKNIPSTVFVYRIAPKSPATERARDWRTWRNGALFASVLLTSAASGGLFLGQLQDRQAPSKDHTQVGSNSAPASATNLVSPPDPSERAAASPLAPDRAAQIPGDRFAAASPLAPSSGDPLRQEAAEAAPLASLSRRPPARFQEPEMILLPDGTFEMGSDEDSSEKPIHTVNVRQFWVAKYPVTVREWRHCVAANACSYAPMGGDDSLVSNISWSDAEEFLSWLSDRTGKKYRLPTEAEWEYAARAGSRTRYWWGDQIGIARADCRGCGGPHDPRQPMTVSAFSANPFGLHDMAGGVSEWVSDCWHKDYRGAPKDGSSWDAPGCDHRVLRGGSWRDSPLVVRVSDREHFDADVRYPTHGFRVARTE